MGMELKSINNSNFETYSYVANNGASLKFVYLNEIENGGKNVKISPINFVDYTTEQGVMNIVQGLNIGNIAIFKKVMTKEAKVATILTISQKNTVQIAKNTLTTLYVGKNNKEVAAGVFFAEQTTQEEKLALKVIINWAKLAKNNIVANSNERQPLVVKKKEEENPCSCIIL